MRSFVVKLESKSFDSFRCIKAAQSQDIDVFEKNTHYKKISADVDAPYNVGLIVGSSGSGKTTLARKIFGNLFSEESIIVGDKPILDQFPESMTYEEIQTALSGVGLTSVPCWIRSANTLSNGQRFRAEVAVQCSKNQDGPIIIDEWTSVVDRTVAKIMSHSVQKFARKHKKKIVLLSCHYDVIDWLQPDWIIDCNLDSFECRRLLQKQRSEQIEIEIRECSTAYWPLFSKYHYLSERLPGGRLWSFGVFLPNENNKIIGFGAYANYIPGKIDTVHSNRVVIHPDYCGLGIGGVFVDITANEMKRRGFRVLVKHSSIPRFKQLSKNPKWKLLKAHYKTVATGCLENTSRSNSARNNVRWYSWEYVG